MNEFGCLNTVGGNKLLNMHLDNGKSTRNFSCIKLTFTNSFEEHMQYFWQQYGCF